MNVRDHQGSLLSRGGVAATLRSIDWQKHHLCRWLVAALCFASSCAHAQSSVTLAWDRNTETNIAGYRLYYGTVTRVYTDVVNAGNATTASVLNLAPGVTYRFAVTAFNTLGVESDYSSEIAFTTTNIVTPNMPPTLTSIADRTIDQNTATGPIGFVIGDAETPAVSLVLSASSSNPFLIPNQNIVFGGSGSSRTVNVTPATDQTGTAIITITVSDGSQTASDSWLLTVNSTPTTNTPPALSGIRSTTIFSGGSSFPIRFSVTDAETPSEALQVWTVSSNPNLIPAGNIAFQGSGSDRTLTVRAANAVGSATITLSANDGSGNTQSTNFGVSVVARPAQLVYLPFEAEEGAIVSPMQVYTDASATYVATTSANQGTVSLQFSITQPGNYILWARHLSPNNARDSFFVAVDGVEIPYATAIGSWSDDWQWTRVTVPDSASTQDPRVLNLSAGTHTVTFRGNEANCGLDRIIICNDLEFIPGVGGNTAPSLSSFSARTINEDTSTGPIAFTVSDAETPGSLVIAANSSNPSLVPTANMTIGGTGTDRTLTVTPAPNQSGTATIAVSVSDGSLSATRTFQLTVTSINDAPTITGIVNSTTAEDTATAPIAFTVGDAETTAASLTLSGTSSDQTLVPNANIVFGGSGASRTVRVAPAANQFGIASISVSVSDGSLSATRSFQLTVSSINDPPTIAALPAATVPLNILTALQPVVVADVDTAASSLVVTGTSSDTNVLPNANIIIGTLGVTRTLSVHPLQTGTATVTVRVSDGLAQNSQSFLLTVTNVMTPNIPPTLNGLANVTISEDAGTQTVLVTGISSGGENQTLTVTASATPQSLISSIETVYTSPRTTGTVSFVTAPNAWGTGTVNVTVSDGLAQTARSFTVTVTPANDAPTLTSIANSTTVEDTATAPIAFTVGDAETTAASLTLSGTSSDQTLVPNANIVFGGSGASRTVRVTPAANQFGTTSISVSVSDGSLSAMRTFQLTVTSSNDPPTVATIANATTVEDTATPPISFTIGDVETAATGLTVSGTSSSLTIVPNGNIVFGGSGANRTVRVTPAANQFGTASINVLVSDGAASSIRTFQVTVMSSNDPPTMATLLPATALPGTLTALQPVVIADIDTAASSLVVTGTSSDTNVLPNANILLGTLGLSRTLSVRPVQTGAATVTLRVSDGFAQSTQSFLLTVTNATGQFALSPSLNVTNGGFRITWDSRIGYMYRVLTKTSLTQTTWIPLSNIRATNTTTSWTDFAGGQQAMGVYKIEMSAPIGFEN